MGQFSNKKLGAIFQELGLIDVEQEKAALAFSKKNGVPFGRACVKMGFLDDPTVVQGLAMQMGAPSISLRSVTVSPDILAKVPSRSAEAHRCIPIAIQPGPGKGTLVLAIASPRNLKAIDEIQFMTGHRVSAVIASDADIDAALQRFYGVEVDRHSRSTNMVEFEMDSQVVELANAEIISDPLEFLPTITVNTNR